MNSSLKYYYLQYVAQQKYMRNKNVRQKILSLHPHWLEIELGETVTRL